MKWAKTKISAIANKINSGGTPSTSIAEYYNGEIPWLRTQEVNFNRITQTEIKITESGLRNSAAKWIPENSVIVALYGNSAGRVAINKIPLTTNQACCNIILDNKKADYLFLFYRLLKDYEILHAKSRGAAQNNLNSNDIKEYEIPLPPIPTQKKIAATLSTYDDLIENNLRRIELLENAARLIYKEWFIKLNFPGREHTKIVDGVPKGWERKKLGDVCQSIGGGTPSTSISEYWEDGDVIWVTPTDITRNKCIILTKTEKKITQAGFKNCSARMLPPDTILMTSRASIGYFGLIDKEVCTNQGFISVIPNEEYYRMYLLFNLKSRKEEIDQKASGSTYKEINKTTFRDMDIVMPSKQLLEEYYDLTYTIIKQIRNLKKSNDNLISARDILLPKLMTGEIAA